MPSNLVKTVLLSVSCSLFIVNPAIGQAPGPALSSTYVKIKRTLDGTPAIDTHDHLFPFETIPAFVETEHGRGVNLAGIWRNSYLSRIRPVTAWTDRQKFEDWWAKAKHDFANVRTSSLYRYQAIGLNDLYGVDFDRISDVQARELNDRIYRNYLTRDWLFEVVTKKANIELMFNDPYWARFAFTTDYPFEVIVLNVTTLPRGFHHTEFKSKYDDPYAFAKSKQLEIKSLDDYLQVMDALFREGKSKGAVCLKTTAAYQRTLLFERVPKDRAEQAFGRPASELTAQQIKDFEDYIVWQLAVLSAKHELPFQIHTGDARIQGSNPMLLVELIEANPKTKFILFHGGYPWVSETGAIAMKFASHVWIDSCWLPTLSYTTAKRAYHEWLDAVPSDRIMWGADCNHAEGIYGATEMTRRCLAEVLAERVDRGEVHVEHAEQIGRQILRENALSLFPQLRAKLWKKSEK